MDQPDPAALVDQPDPAAPEAPEGQPDQLDPAALVDQPDPADRGRTDRW